MPRDTSNTTTKARNSKYAAATGLKTGNLKVKGAPPALLFSQRRTELTPPLARSQARTSTAMPRRRGE